LGFLKWILCVQDNMVKQCAYSVNVVGAIVVSMLLVLKAVESIVAGHSGYR